MKTIVFLGLIFASCLSFAQDERFYRDIFAGNLYDPPEKFKYKVLVESPKYMIDLNRDKRKDSIQISKKDGVDFVKINNEYGQSVFERKLLAKGLNSKVYRARLKKINKSVNVLILYYYEGDIDTVKHFKGSARLFFITIRDNNLNKITFMKGPYIFTEESLPGDKYSTKSFAISTIDFNGDKQAELSVSYNHIQRTYFYKGDGLWDEL